MARRRGSTRRGSTDIQRFLPPPDLTILLDIAPETAVRRKAAGRDRYERDLALLSRVRASYRRQAEAGGLAAARRRAAEGRRRGGRHRRESRHDSRCGKRAHLARARLAQHDARTPPASPPSCSHRPPARSAGLPRCALRASANASRTFAWRRAAGRSVCDGVARTRRSRLLVGSRKAAGDAFRLVEPAGAQAASMQRHRHDEVDPDQDLRALMTQQLAQRPCKRSAPVVLQRVKMALSVPS